MTPLDISYEVFDQAPDYYIEHDLTVEDIRQIAQSYIEIQNQMENGEL